MLNDLTVQYSRGNDGINGVPLVWVIDGECLYDIPIWPNYKDMFMNSDLVIDVSTSYPNHNGITVRFMKNDLMIDDFQTSEYFGSILLSNPLVLDLQEYPYGRYVTSPHATFDGEKFTITDRDMSTLIPWAPTQPQYVDPDQV